MIFITYTIHHFPLVGQQGIRQAKKFSLAVNSSYFPWFRPGQKVTLSEKKMSGLRPLINKVQWCVLVTYHHINQILHYFDLAAAVHFAEIAGGIKFKNCLRIFLFILFNEAVNIF